MANTVINTPELLNLDSTTGATVLAKGTVNERPPTPAFGVDYLVVAGGGGGGGGVTSESPGGGGAGAVIYQAAGLNVIPSSEYTLYIADGGAGGGNNAQGTNGQDSYISFGGSNVVLAKGGGGGGSYAGPGKNGGSGGGGTRDGDTNNSQAGGSAVTTNIAPAGASIYGNNGASGNGSCSGGGGGAGAVGAVPTGGDGVQINIDGNNYFWGGGGGACGSGGTGGQGGGGGGPRGGQGGTGGINPGTSTGSSADGGGNGGANTGGGGGGATNPTGYPGGTGGSGIIILRYPNTQTITIGSGLTGTTATVGSEKVTTFTAGTGTISFSGTVVGGENDATDGALRFNTEANKTEYFDGTGWYEIVDEYASGFIGPATNYFDTKLYTGNGSTQSIGGYINGSASFNGSSAYISSSNILDTSSAFSYSLWVKPNTIATYDYLIGHQQAGSPYAGVGLLGIAPNTFALALGGGAPQDMTPSLTLGDWTHLVLTHDGSGNYTCYTNDNGSPITYSGATSNNSSNPFRLGFSSVSGWGYYDGDIDQVRIYNTELSSADVTALYNETAATASTAAFPSGQTAIATYTMDTSANGLLNTQDLNTVDYPSGAGCLALYEMNGNSNDTSNTYNGTPTNITYQGGAFDQAAVFNGSSSEIDLPVGLGANGDRTRSFWINVSAFPASGGDNIYYIGQQSVNDDYENLNIRSDGTIRFQERHDSGGSGDLLIDSQTTINLNQWYNITIVFDGLNRFMYINGSTALGNTGTKSTQTVNNSAYAGNLGSFRGLAGTLTYDGLIDQVRIFNTALTQSQVTTLARGIATSYSGAATNVNFNGHLDFAPNFVWIKNRSSSGNNNALFDSVRGVQRELRSDTTNAENNYTSTDYSLKSYDANGFTVGDITAGNYNVNGAVGGTYSGNAEFVAWNWKGGGGAVTNNDGTIASQVSANKDSGFSIVKFTGSLTSGQKVGHGLSSAPEMVILKNLDFSANWYIYHQGTGTTSGYINYLKFDSTVGSYSDKIFYPINFNSTTFTPGNDAVLQGNVIAYCWHSVAGYSRIGSYTGTGATSSFTGFGFQPRWITIKRTDSTGNWWAFDSARGNNKGLRLNLSNAEDTTDADANTNEYRINFLSDGFQYEIDNSTSASPDLNASSGTYIYLAIA